MDATATSPQPTPGEKQRFPQPGSDPRRASSLVGFNHSDGYCS